MLGTNIEEGLYSGRFSLHDLFDQAVGTQPFHQTGDLSLILASDTAAQVFCSGTRW